MGVQEEGMGVEEEFVFGEFKTTHYGYLCPITICHMG